MTPPANYRLATAEDRQGEKPEGTLVLISKSWQETWGGWWPQHTYAVPITANPTATHYRHQWLGHKLDPYRILAVYGITHPAQQHAIKKMLRAGNSIKSLKDDIKEVRDSLDRWLEMIEEDVDTNDDN